MTLDRLAPGLEAERVVVPERACRCGGRFMVIQIKGEPGPRVMHKNPICRQFDKLQGPRFYRWIVTGREDDDAPEGELADAYRAICGEDPPKAPLPNRRQRRVMGVLKPGEAPRRPLPRERPKRGGKRR